MPFAAKTDGTAERVINEQRDPKTRRDPSLWDSVSELQDGARSQGSLQELLQFPVRPQHMGFGITAAG